MSANDLYIFDNLLVKSPEGELFKLYYVDSLPEGFEICEGEQFYTSEGYLREKYWGLPNADLDLFMMP